MATDSPITTISSWHRHHLRHRKRSATAEEAFASAVYYSECSLGGISPRGAATAEENVRRNHSRWWLRGDDPNHPTLQSVDANKIKSSSSDLKSSGKDQAMQSDAAAGNNSNAEGTLEEAGNNDVRDAINHDVDVLRQDNSNSPIFVHDNDYGLSFGTLGNFSSERILQTATSRSSTPPTSVVGETQHELSQATSESVAYGSFTSSSSCNSNASISRSSRPTMKRQRTDDPPPFDQTVIDAKIIAAKTELLSSLEQEGISPAFKVALASLERYSNHNVLSKQRELSSVSTPATTTTTNQDGADSTNIDGTWRMISPPEYPSSLGKNSNGEGLFTLGRMSFDMYQPSDLICSIQKQYNTIQSVEPDEVPLYVPRSLIREVAEGRNAKCRGGLKTYK